MLALFVSKSRINLSKNSIMKSIRSHLTKFFSLLIGVVLISSASTTFAQQKRIYLAPDDHTDYMWTADEETYRNSFLTMLDYYLNRMDATAANPSPYQARFNADGSFWMWTYERNRTPAQFQRFINRVQDGHLSVALNPLVLVNGGTPAEALLRGMYYPGLIERRYNVRFPSAMAMENQTHPYGLTSLWAGSGVKYSWKGVCGCASQTTGLDNRDREIYYSGGADGSRVLMKWNSLFPFPTLGIGSYAEARNAGLTVNFVDQNPIFTSRYPYQIIGAFGQGGDDLETTSDDHLIAAQNLSNANRQIIVSNEIDFFQDFEANYGAQLPTFAASFGNEWEILVASMAEVSARVKRSLEKLRSAEAMATLVALNNPSFMNSRIAERDKAMLNFGLYFEHDWTADGVIPREARADWNRRIEREISSYVDKLYEDARVELGKQISRSSGSEQRIFVFNPLSWARTDYADFPFKQNRKVHVVDVSTGAEVPSQILRFGNRKVLRILAENVPSVGYKVFEIRNRSGADFSTAATTANGNVIENNFYRLTLANDGAVTSLIDKTRSNRETVRAINGRVLNDLGGNRTGKVTIENAGAVSVTLRAESSNPIAHVSRITLYRNSNRIDVENQITQNFGDVKTWSFSFDVNSPDVWHEEVGAVIRGKLLGSGGHYSPKNARYDWLTMNHFADLSDGAANNFGVTVSNADAYFMKLGASSASVLDAATPQINVLSGGQVDGENLGIPNQGGDSFFQQRFALQTHNAFNQTDAMKFALEHQNPLTAGSIEGFETTARAYPANNFSFVQISNPNVLLWALKPAEDGISNGITARVWNQSGAPANYNLSLSRTITAAQKVTHIETFVENAAVIGGQLNANINQQQIQTHLLKIGN
jgi:alpha-mannosidase